MEFALPFFSILIIVLFCGLAVCLGRILFEKIFLTNSATPPAWQMGASFFLGLCALTVWWRFLDFILGRAAWALALAVLSSFILCIFQKKTSWNTLQQWTHLLRKKIVWLIILLTALFTLFIEVDAQLPDKMETLANLGSSSAHLYPNQAVAFANIGSSHAGIHSEVASFIAENNRIPVTGLDIGRSLLSAIPLFIGINLPVWNSFIWLVITKLGFLLLIFGLFQKLGLSIRYAIYGTILVFFGNTGLSFLHLITSSSMNPAFFINYASPLIILGLSCIFIVWLTEWTGEKSSYHHLFSAALFCVILITSCIFGLHLIVVTLPVLAVYLIYRTWNKTLSLLHCATLILICAGTLAYCVFSGCGLTPVALRDRNLSISKHMNTLNQTSHLGINPGVWYSAYIFGSSHLGHNYDRTRDMPLFSFAQGVYQRILKGKILEKFYAIFDLVNVLENEIWFTLRLFFFPILGFTSLFFTMRNKHHCTSLQPFWKIGLMVFILGIGLSFFFDIPSFPGAKNTLSRFSHFGVLFGMISLAFSTAYWIPRWLQNKSKQNMVWISLMGLICLGPTLSLLTESYINLTFQGFPSLLQFMMTH